MVGSIDPRCETVRGTHWPKKGREVVWSSRRGNHLGQRPKATASTGRTYGCKRSDQTKKNSCGTGAVHIWIPGSLASLAPRNDDYSFLFTTRNVALARAMTTSSALIRLCAKQIVLPVLITSVSTVSHCPIWALLMKSIDILTVTSE